MQRGLQIDQLQNDKGVSKYPKCLLSHESHTLSISMTYTQLQTKLYKGLFGYNLHLLIQQEQ